MGALKAEAEFVSYAPGDDSIESRTGYYAYAGYDWKNSWTTGVLYDALSSDTSGGDDYTSMGLVVTRELSKSAKLRAQFMSNNNETDDSAIYAQIVFNLK